jgi:hypothetical protein
MRMNFLSSLDLTAETLAQIENETTEYFTGRLIVEEEGGLLTDENPLSLFVAVQSAGTENAGPFTLSSVSSTVSLI